MGMTEKSFRFCSTPRTLGQDFWTFIVTLALLILTFGLTVQPNGQDFDTKRRETLSTLWFSMKAGHWVCHWLHLLMPPAALREEP